MSAILLLNSELPTRNCTATRIAIISVYVVISMDYYFLARTPEGPPFLFMGRSDDYISHSKAGGPQRVHPSGTILPIMQCHMQIPQKEPRSGPPI
ncbi:hypothetical protein ACN38_g2241 [Penicillium nordicum]|uniref:Uncharacterized protein n=1 Tax=Penicillium nordicum TaxID=229535 RepID=A0A0M9WJ20_9EURO|nr:hypothetical protein ACN38_g2241 [Penicillium nordicum]